MTSLKKTASRLKLETTENELSEAAANTLIRRYTKKRGQRSDETVAAAQQLAIKRGIILKEKPAIAKQNSPATLKSPKSSTSKRKKQDVLGNSLKKAVRSQGLVYLVLILAIIWQIDHTAHVVGAMDSKASIWLDYSFAIGIQLTALLMTIHKGSKHFLIIFAFIEFFINLIYYSPWSTGGMLEWTQALLISGTIAFTIYSYSELITTEK